MRAARCISAHSVATPSRRVTPPMRPAGAMPSRSAKQGGFALKMLYVVTAFGLYLLPCACSLKKDGRLALLSPQGSLVLSPGVSQGGLNRTGSAAGVAPCCVASFPFRAPSTEGPWASGSSSISYRKVGRVEHPYLDPINFEEGWWWNKSSSSSSWYEDK